MRPGISAVVMVYNERATIERCLDALAFCDERIVLDDGSTDGTYEVVAARSDVRLYRHRHTTFAAQRELGKSFAIYPWLLTMDGDEFVTPALAERIQDVLIGNPPVDGYFLKRRNPYPRTLDGEYWSQHPRLTRTARTRWVATENPHSPLDLSGMRMGLLDGPHAHLEHEPLASVPAMLRKSINRSATLASQERRRGHVSSSARLLASAAARFFKMYFSGGAWRFGVDGLIFAGATAFEAWVKYAVLAEHAPMLSSDGGPGSLAGAKESPPPR
jgi:glycosyltransferase involved in cell wall biosynthesis